METKTNALVRAELLAMYASYAAALESRDAAALARHYGDDAVILIPGADIIAGADSVRAYCEGLCAVPYRFRLNGFSVEHVLVSGEYAIEVSHYAVASTPLHTYGEAVAETKSLLVWRKGARWAIVREVYNDIRA